MDVTFIWLMVCLKVPIIALLWLVWWAVHQKPETEGSSGDGLRRPHPHPRRPLPRLPRRGPHGDEAPAAPARVRHTTFARGRRLPRTPSS